MSNTENDPQTRISGTDARAGRIVKGGAMRRTLWVSIALAVVALAVVYLIFFR